jgi:uncharacterized RDD family membrane protein YckC
VGDRIIARLVDYGIFIGYFIGLSFILSHQDNYLVWVSLSLPIVFYSLLCEYFLNGQTFGKKVLNIKVIRLDGNQPTLGNYIMRWMFRLIDTDIMGGLIGIITIAASQNGQRFGDMLAGTTVVKLKKEILLEDALLNAEDKEKEMAYVPTFPQVTALNDQQIQLIREVIAAFKKEGSYELLTNLSDKLKTLLHVQSNMPAFEFLNTLLNDYAALNSNS